MGDGVINGDVTNNGGIVAPGNSPGTLTINGNFLEKNRGFVKIYVAGTAIGQYSTLVVNGVANLSEGALQLSFINGFVPQVGDRWNVLTANTLRGFNPRKCTFDGLSQGSMISCYQIGNVVWAKVTAVIPPALEVSFSSFSAKLEVKRHHANRDILELNANFTLGHDSDGIKPWQR